MLDVQTGFPEGEARIARLAGKLAKWRLTACLNRLKWQPSPWHSYVVVRLGTYVRAFRQQVPPVVSEATKPMLI